MCPNITFGDSAAETVAEELGLEERNGTLVNKETGEPEIPAGRDEPISIDEFGGAAKGSMVTISDDFNSISKYVEDHYTQE